MKGTGHFACILSSRGSAPQNFLLCSESSYCPNPLFKILPESALLHPFSLILLRHDFHFVQEGSIKTPLHLNLTSSGHSSLSSFTGAVITFFFFSSHFPLTFFLNYKINQTVGGKYIVQITSLFRFGPNPYTATSSDDTVLPVIWILGIGKFMMYPNIILNQKKQVKPIFIVEIILPISRSSNGCWLQFTPLRIQQTIYEGYLSLAKRMILCITNLYDI